MKIRKQVNELTLDDLSKFPVWEFALDEEGVVGQDETTVRPYMVSGAIHPSVGMLVVRASFTLADGSKMQGYLTPPPRSDHSLGMVQPIIITAAGQVSFWRGIIPLSTDDLAWSYRALGRGASHVFPVGFESEVELIGGPIRGTLKGFMVLEDMKTGKFKTLT